MLRLRAEQLTSSATRRLLARALRSVVEGAEGPSQAWGSVRPPLQREEVLAARDDLLALADRLSEPRVVDPGAAACAAALVWDSGSPVYSRDTGESVAAVAQDVLAALDAAA